MGILNKIALSFVVFFSLCIMINIYLGETERAQSNVVYFLMNGFAYLVSAWELEKDKNKEQNSLAR
jgi:hypothetical protein